MRCDSCGRDNDPAARFCDTCGARLEPGPPAATRKTVTVVFSDVVDSTALGERLDPESLRHVMWRYFETVQAVLERHGGTVEKFIGDAIMAVFGVPAVHEDDALRAVRAVADARDALGLLNDQLEREHGVRIVTRTGVNTGEVIVGGDGAAGDQRLATGDAVNVAARLEQAAGAGEVLLGAQTYAAVADVVVVESVDPLAAKGKREPLTAWRLVAVRPDVPAYARPIRTPFVGRRNEFDELQDAFATAVQEQTCVLATVVGTPGIGKSRLARELIRSLETQARVVIGRCPAYGEGIAYLPLAEIVRGLDGEDPEARLVQRLAVVERGEVAARLIAGAVGVVGGAGSPEETAWAFRRLFETLAEQQPLVVVADDIHWADSTLLDLLEYVSGFSSGAPILLLCLARPDLFEARPSWAAPRRHTKLVSLEPLDSGESEQLVDALLEQHTLPETLRRRVVETAEGNPLFVEQLLAMLVDDPEADQHDVPETITALLSARLDRLLPEERAVLQRAAVEGRLFHRGSVAELSGSAAEQGLGPTLLALTRKEFVRPDRSLFEGDDAFRFNHVLIRDVAYASMPKELRGELHARLAAWLKARPADRSGRDEIVGYHLEQAYGCRVDLGKLDEETRALGVEGGRLLALAGRRAADRLESAAAVSLLRRACLLLELQQQERAALLRDLGQALVDNGALEEAETVLDEAVAEARGYGDEPTEARAEIQLTRLGFMRTHLEPETVRTVARRAIAVFERVHDDAGLADAWQLMGIAELAARAREAQLQALLRAREHATAAGDLRRQIEAWNEVGGAMLFGRTPVPEVVAFCAEELAWARERGLAAVEADALLAGPYLYSRLGRFDEARDRLERSKAICRELGIAYGLAEAHMAGAELELNAGDPAAAERELREAIRVATEMGASRYVALYRTRIAHVLIDLDRDGDALDELEQARMYEDTAFWKTARARILARRGETGEAVVLARAAEAFMADSDDITARANDLVDIAEVLRANDQPAEAARALTEAAALHEEKGNVLPAQRCRELLEDLEREGAPAAEP
jgi:class 3 adenylate cyclase/tetratricopeptide (TPR) repeat protein